MTRFARARGSKASNERTPEDSTPWEIMKGQLMQAKNEEQESKKKREAENKRIENYENFLKEHKTQKRKSVWCEFEDIGDNSGKNNQQKKELPTKNNKKKKINEESDFLNTIDDTVKMKTKKSNINITIDEEAGIQTSDNKQTSDDKNSTKVKKKKKNKKQKGVIIDDQTNNKTISVDKDFSNVNSIDASYQSKKDNFSETKNKMKKLSGKKPMRRKAINDKSFQLIINGKEVELLRFDGFPVMKKDAERLEELKKSMIQKGIPKSEVMRTMKLERRRAEKALARIKREVCYNCRKGGHNLSDCPDLKSKIPGVDAAEGVCFKCGSTEHRQFECKVQRDKEFRFATCFICKEPGHIARQCPDNPKGLYPNGGSCKLCGDVTHLRKDCPTVQDKREEASIKLHTIENMSNLEDVEHKKSTSIGPSKKPKKIKF